MDEIEKENEVSKKIEQLIQDLKDENWYVRKNAAWALGKMEDKRIVEPLINAIAHSREISKKQLDKLKLYSEEIIDSIM